MALLSDGVERESIDGTPQRQLIMVTRRENGKGNVHLVLNDCADTRNRHAHVNISHVHYGGKHLFIVGSFLSSVYNGRRNDVELHGSEHVHQHSSTASPFSLSCG